VHNLVVGNSSRSLAVAESQAQTRGYSILNLGPRIEGETQEVARDAAATLSEQKQPRVCVLIGGETTVTLPTDHGKGGRNTEFVLAALLALEPTDSRDYVVLSGGTDGEDGPTDAAGAIGDDSTIPRARALGLDPADFLGRHDSYTFFDATGDLIRSGLTQTNVMDVRVLLAGPGTFGRREV
jgi:glycerate-2-kinase